MSSSLKYSGSDEMPSSSSNKVLCEWCGSNDILSSILINQLVALGGISVKSDITIVLNVFLCTGQESHLYVWSWIMLYSLSQLHFLL